MDQYDHIVDSQHTIDEVFEWFNNNGIQATSYFPNNFNYSETDFEKFFNDRKLNETSFIERILVQDNETFDYMQSRKTKSFTNEVIFNIEKKVVKTH